MAIIVDSKTTTASSGGSIYPDMPTAAQEEGDIILVVALNDDGRNPIEISGWQEVAGTSPQNNSRCACLYTTNTGTEIVSPEVLGTSNDWIVYVAIIRDAKEVSLLTQASREDFPTSVREFGSPPANSLSSDGLVLRVFGIDDGAVLSPSYGYGVREETSTWLINNLSLNITSEVVPDQGSVTQHYYNSGSDNNGGFSTKGTTYTLVFENSTGGEVEGSVSALPVVIEDYSSSPTHFNISDRRSNLIGLPTAPFSTVSISRPFTTSDLDWFGGYTRYQVTPDASFSVQMLCKNIPSTDLSEYPYSITFGISNTFLFADEGPLFYFEDGQGNWALWQPLTEEEFGNGQFKTLIAYMPEEYLVDQSLLSIDWSDIVITGSGASIVDSRVGLRNIFASCECVAAPINVIGGHPEKPSNLELITKTISTGLSIYRAKTNGEGQALITQSINIGNLATKTHFVGKADSFAYPLKNSGTMLGYKCGDMVHSVRVLASSECTMDFRSWVLRSPNTQKFIIDPQSSTSANILTSGWILKGFKVTWKSGISCEKANFVACDLIDIKSSDFVGCSIVGSVSSTYAMVAEDGASIGSSFEKGLETYAIALPDGAYDLSNSSFEGYASDLHLTGSSGTVVITLSQGQQIPTYTSNGSALEVVQELVRVSAPLILPSSNARNGLVLLNVTRGTLIEYRSNLSDSEQYYSRGIVLNEDYDIGDTLELRAGWQIGFTASNKYRARFIASGSSLSTPDGFTEHPYVPDLLIDGSEVTELTVGNGQVEVDITDVDGLFDPRGLAAWTYYMMTTEVGLRYYFEVGDLVSVAEFRLNQNVPLNNSGTVQVRLANPERELLRQYFQITTLDPDFDFVKHPSSGGQGINYNGGPNTIIQAPTYFSEADRQKVNSLASQESVNSLASQESVNSLASQESVNSLAEMSFKNTEAEVHSWLDSYSNKDSYMAEVAGLGLSQDQSAMLEDLWKIGGLDENNPMVVSEESRSSGVISLQISKDLDGVVTVARIHQ